jgi:hypothetical protein
MGIPVFFCERTGRRFYHRVFHCGECGHHMKVPCDQADYDAFGDGPRAERSCAECGATITQNGCGSVEEFQRADTGALLTELPPGAVYEVLGYYDDRKPYNWRQSPREDGKRFIVTRRNEQDGRVLACVCPDGHHWTIDARASNCTMPDDDGHWCWVRHGRPEDGTLHVDKEGVTCAEGAGSIQTSQWHGFLHNGQLVQC